MQCSPSLCSRPSCHLVASSALKGKHACTAMCNVPNRSATPPLLQGGAEAGTPTPAAQRQPSATHARLRPPPASSHIDARCRRLHATSPRGQSHTWQLLRGATGPSPRQHIGHKFPYLSGCGCQSSEGQQQCRTSAGCCTSRGSRGGAAASFAWGRGANSCAWRASISGDGC